MPSENYDAFENGAPVGGLVVLHKSEAGRADGKCGENVKQYFTAERCQLLAGGKRSATSGFESNGYG